MRAQLDSLRGALAAQLYIDIEVAPAEAGGATGRTVAGGGAAGRTVAGSSGPGAGGEVAVGSCEGSVSTAFLKLESEQLKLEPADGLPAAAAAAAAAAAPSAAPADILKQHMAEVDAWAAEVKRSASSSVVELQHRLGSSASSSVVELQQRMAGVGEGVGEAAKLARSVAQEVTT